MVDLRAIEQIMNPVTGQWVRFPKPVMVTCGDIDSFIAGYQQRLADEMLPLPADSDGDCRARALELATQLHCARTKPGVGGLGDSFQDSAVLETADRFAMYLRGGSDG